MKSFSWSWNRLAVGAVVLFLLYMSLPIFLLLVLSLLASLLLLPLANFAERQLQRLNLSQDQRRNGAIILVFLLSATCLSFIGLNIFQPLIREIASFIATLPETINSLQQSFVRLLSESQDLYFALPVQIKEIVDTGAQKILTFTITQINSLLQMITNLAPVAIQAVLLPFLVYYFLRDREELQEGSVKMFPVRRYPEIRSLLHELCDVLSKYVRGQITVCIIIGGFIFCGTSLLGVKYPLVLGLLSFLLGSIPYAGAIFAFIPALLLALSVSVDLALQVTALYLFVSFLENYFIVPKIMGKVAQLHPLIILLGMLLAANWFGLIGMILAVPVMATLKILIRFVWNWR